MTTLPERLVSEAREEIQLSIQDGTFSPEKVDQIILHTIEQTIKEGCEVVEKNRISFESILNTVERVDKNRMHGYNHGLDDTQHALRGIIG